MVAYHALAHCAANIERHGGGGCACNLVLYNYSAHLRAVAVRNYNFVAAFNNIRYVFAGLFHHLKLSLRGCGLSGFLQCVAAKGYN